MQKKLWEKFEFDFYVVLKYIVVVKDMILMQVSFNALDPLISLLFDYLPWETSKIHLPRIVSDECTSLPVL